MLVSIWFWNSVKQQICLFELFWLDLLQGEYEAHIWNLEQNISKMKK